MSGITPIIPQMRPLTTACGLEIIRRRKEAFAPNLLKGRIALAALSEKRPTFPSDRTFFQPNTLIGTRGSDGATIRGKKVIQELICIFLALQHTEFVCLFLTITR